MKDQRYDLGGTVRATRHWATPREKGRWAGARGAAPLVAAGLALALAAWTTSVSWAVSDLPRTPAPPVWLDVAYHAFGVPFILGGALVWWRTPWIRLGVLLLILGASYYLAFLRVLPEHPVLYVTGFCLAYLYVGVFGHIAMSVPTGSLSNTVDRVYVVLAYVASVGSQVGRYLADQPSNKWNFNLPQINTAWGKFGSYLVAVIGVVGVVLVLRRLLTSLRARRRRTGPVWGTLALIGVLLLAPSLGSALSLPLDSQLMFGVLLVCGTAVVSLGGYLLWMGFAWSDQIRLTALPLRLAGQRQLGALQAALADTLGDPTLRLVFPRPDGTFPEPRKSQPTEGQGRAATPIHRGGRLLCVIDHDPAVASGDRATAIAIALTGLTLENAQLYREVRESRSQLTTATFEERKRIARDMHDGTQQRFFAALLRLGMATERLDAGESPQAAALLEQAKTELLDGIEALRALAQGLHPVDLEQYGLAQAIAVLADRSPVVTDVSIPPIRWPPTVESTAYFVISEALANVYKHAGATRVSVTITPAETAESGPGELVVRVADDGVGGADASGTGLRGLAARVGAVDGTFGIDSDPRAGTRLTVRIPLPPEGTPL
ncbi:sensor histidine kinase [Streptosporangium sp. G11]|uniref:sensor histidine kinase n=1 Tax=Streptosporangium sp. G11 TaxID=3436926 RepID=UPI003EBF8E94